MKYFNTTLGLSMLPDGNVKVETISEKEAMDYMDDTGIINCANPSHKNSLIAIANRLKKSDIVKAIGGRVNLKTGDSCLVAQISNVPRVTREFSDREINNAFFNFRIVTVN